MIHTSTLRVFNLLSTWVYLSSVWRRLWTPSHPSISLERRWMILMTLTGTPRRSCYLHFSTTYFNNNPTSASWAWTTNNTTHLSCRMWWIVLCTLPTCRERSFRFWVSWVRWRAPSCGDNRVSKPSWSSFVVCSLNLTEVWRTWQPISLDVYCSRVCGLSVIHI